MIPYGKQSIDKDDIDAVIEVLKSDFLTCGPKFKEFEQALAEYCGAEHAVAVSNGTAALHLCMLAARIGPGDRVLTSANTFLASANCAEFVGATTDFADIDPETLCLSIETLEAAWRDDVKAVVAVDFAGYPCITKEIGDFVHERGAIIIEDGCHAIGGGRDGHKVGGLPWVDMTTFSFHPVKTMTTGEGGAVLTHNTQYAERIRLLRSHGMVRDPKSWQNDPNSLTQVSGFSPHTQATPWYYEMHQLGYNYRITDLQCALGVSQLKKLDKFVQRRQEIVDQYNKAFAGLEHITRPISAKLSSSREPSSSAQRQGTKNQEPRTRNYEQPLSAAWHLYVLQIDFPTLGTTRKESIHALAKAGVGTQVHYIPVHTQPYYQAKYGFDLGYCPNAEAYYDRCLSLPLFPIMTDRDIYSAVSAISKLIG